MKRIGINIFAILVIGFGSAFLSSETALAEMPACEAGKWQLQCATSGRMGPVVCCTVCTTTGDIGDCQMIFPGVNL